MKYHNTPNGPRICHDSSGRCPYLRQGYPHYDTQEEAQKAYDASMAEKFGAFETVRRTRSEKTRQKVYRGLDRMRKARASEPVRKVVRTIRAAHEASVRTGSGLQAARSRFRAVSRSVRSRSSQVMRNMRVRTVDVVAAEHMTARDAESEYGTRRSRAQHAVVHTAAETAYRASEAQQKLSENVSNLGKVAARRVGNITVRRKKSAAHVQIGDRLRQGEVVGVSAAGGGVQITTRQPNGTHVTLFSKPDSTMKTSRTVRQHLTSIRNSPFGRRVHRAAELQSQSFRTLFNVHESSDDHARQESRWNEMDAVWRSRPPREQQVPESGSQMA